MLTSGSYNKTGRETAMQEVTVGTPKGKGEQIARIALEQGLTEATISQVRVVDAEGVSEQEEVKVSVAAPDAARFIDAVMGAPFFDPLEYSVISDNVSAIVSSETPENVARPMKVGSITVLQDLWQQNHVTPAFIARAAVSALLLAYALMEADMATLVIALLFTPFLSQALAVSFGGWMGDWKLARLGLKVLGLTTIVAIAAGAVTALVMGGQMKYDQFGTLQSNFAISLLVGAIAGLDTADEAGRREFIAVAGAAQFTSFPVWLGISLVLGFPDPQTTVWRLVTPVVNTVTILLVSLAVYAGLRYRRENIARYAAATRAGSQSG